MDYLLGPFFKSLHVLTSYLWFCQISRLPLEWGPHMATGFLVWRYIANFAIIFVLLPYAVETGNSPWLTVEIGWSIYIVSTVLSVLGFGVFLYYMNPNFDKSRLWRRITGKQFVVEMWYSEEIWGRGRKTKDEDRVNYITTKHPLFLTKKVVEKWITEELVAKHADQLITEGDAEAGEGTLMIPLPSWLNEEFGKRCVSIFKWWGDKDATRRVEEALGRLLKKGVGVEEVGEGG
jgi:hypothetical protein